MSDTATEDMTEFNALCQELIKQAAWIMDNRANEMIVLLAHGFGNAVRQITEGSTDDEWHGTKGRAA